MSLKVGTPLFTSEGMLAKVGKTLGDTVTLTYHKDHMGSIKKATIEQAQQMHAKWVEDVGPSYIGKYVNMRNKAMRGFISGFSKKCENWRALVIKDNKTFKEFRLWKVRACDSAILFVL
jgi:ABC-type oligopeptide transport system substrate-binding subunit